MLWIKAFHIIFMVCWFAGIFYLPRIFVNLAMTENDGAFNQLNLMARKLYRFITPFMILTVGFGIWLIVELPYVMKQGWFHAKLFLVAILMVYHFICGYFQKQFAEGRCQKSHVFFRWFNEFPVVILFAVIILVVVRPF